MVQSSDFGDLNHRPALGRQLPMVIAGKAKQAWRELMLAYHDVQRALRNNHWNLIRYPQVNVTQLFDLRNVPQEVHNLANDPAQAKRIADMMERLQAQP